MKKNIGYDFKSLLTASYLSDMADSHLEAWQERYRNYSRKKDLLFDLRMNHDDSLEIERTEEELGRQLTDDERDYLVTEFHKACGRNFRTAKITY
jgi:hypothetical protein